MTTKPKVFVTEKELHDWYLQSTKLLNPKSYNPNAQKPFENLTKEQQQIDKLIAYKVNLKHEMIVDELKLSQRMMMKTYRVGLKQMMEDIIEHRFQSLEQKVEKMKNECEDIVEHSRYKQDRAECKHALFKLNEVLKLIEESRT